MTRMDQLGHVANGSRMGRIPPLILSRRSTSLVVFAFHVIIGDMVALCVVQCVSYHSTHTLNVFDPFEYFGWTGVF